MCWRHCVFCSRARGTRPTPSRRWRGLAGAREARYALLIMDLNYTRDTTSGQEGLEVIPRIQALDKTLPIVVMTAWATIDLAVEAMKRGARDFIPKPWDNDRLLSIVRTQIELGGRAAQGSAAGSGESTTARQNAEYHRGIAADAAGARADFARRAVGRECSDHGRKRHRQGFGRAGAPRAFDARVAQHDHGEHGRPVGGNLSRASSSVT